MNTLKTRQISGNKVLVLLFFVFLALSLYRNRDTMEGVIWSDTEGYYIYLPAVLIHHTFRDIPQRGIEFKRNEKNEVISKYTSGVSFFYLPFFLIAHLIAHLFHYNTSGFSPPYYYAIVVCAVTWGFIGLYVLRKLLLKYFSNKVTWIVLICILLGTNIFHYITRYVGMSHTYSFALVSGILLLTHHYYRNPGKGKLFLLATLYGWLVLIRPTNCVFLIAIVLFEVASIEDLKRRVIFFKERIGQLFLAIPFFVAPMVPQMLYWKHVYGRFIAYSYENETFIYWKHPKIAATLFDTQNGWLLYSPILLFLFYGLFAGRKDKRTNFPAISILLVLITYIFASWWAWWFGAAFGHRCYIDYYPLLAFPMAIAAEKIIASRKKVFRVSMAVIAAGLVYYSVGLSMLYDHTGIWDGPNWRWNWEAWFEMVRRIIPFF